MGVNIGYSSKYQVVRTVSLYKHNSKRLENCVSRARDGTYYIGIVIQQFLVFVIGGNYVVDEKSQPPFCISAHTYKNSSCGKGEFCPSYS